MNHRGSQKISSLEAGQGDGLEPEVQVLRPEEELGVSAGRGGRHDCHTGTPGPEHQDSP